MQLLKEHFLLQNVTMEKRYYVLNKYNKNSEGNRFKLLCYLKNYIYCIIETKYLGPSLIKVIFDCIIKEIHMIRTIFLQYLYIFKYSI